MKIWHLVVAIVLIFLAIVLLGGRTTTPDGYFNQTNTSGDNGICGGIAGFRCLEGYYCQYSKGDQASYPDESGTCIQCPQYAPMLPDLIDMCKEKNGTIVTEKDGRGCNVPPRCSVEI